MTEHLTYLWVLSPAAGICLLAGGLAYRGRLKTQAEGCRLKTSGKVVGNADATHLGWDTNPKYRPVVEYHVGEQRYSVISDVGRLPQKEVGAKVTVMYNPANPAIAIILPDYYLPANILLLIGAAWLLFGSFIAYQVLCSGN
jgi:hypothetical protein